MTTPVPKRFGSVEVARLLPAEFFEDGTVEYIGGESKGGGLGGSKLAPSVHACKVTSGGIRYWAEVHFHLGV